MLSNSARETISFSSVALESLSVARQLFVLYAAASRAFAIECPLWASEHLHSIDVEEQHIKLCACSNIDWNVVVVHTY